jgi:hypothetical protein
VDAVYPRCSSCNWGLSPGGPAKGGAIQDLIDRNELALCNFLRIVRSVNRPDSAHEEAWKRRRRA